MPKNITIRDIPDDIYQKLKRQAELHHRSINSEVIVTLEKMVKSHRHDASQIIDRANTLKSKAKGSLSMSQIEDAIDQGRP